MENGIKTKIMFVSPDKTKAAINIIPEDKTFPTLAFFDNTKNFKIGSVITVNTSLLKVIEKTSQDGQKVCWLTIGPCNFEIVPDFYKAKTVYMSNSGKQGAIAVIVDGKHPPVLAFFVAKPGRRKGDIVDVPTSLKASMTIKKDGSIFYFLVPGICNFTIAPIINHRSSFDNDDSYTSYSESDDDYYEEQANSVCEYCGNYGCTCQRDLDNKGY